MLKKNVEKKQKTGKNQKKSEKVKKNLNNFDLLQWTKMDILHYGNTGFGVFKRGVKNQKGFYLRITIGTQQKLLNFENWVDGRQKFSKFRVLKSIIFIFSEKKYLKLKSWLNY